MHVGSSWFWLLEKAGRFEALLTRRKLPLWLFLFCLLIGAMGCTLFGWIEKHYAEGYQQFGTLGKAVDTISSFPSLVAQSFTELTTNPLRLPGSTHSGQIGLKYHAHAFADHGYLLLSAYDEQVGASTVRLMRLSDGKILYRWVPDIDEINSRAQYDTRAATRYSKRRFRAIHPLLMPDGGIVINGDGPLVKLNACSRVEWVLNGYFHHSITRGPRGDIWAPTTAEPSTLDTGKFPFVLDDSYARISPAGKLLERRSIARILENNGYTGLLFGNLVEHDNLHLNSIEVASTTSPYWREGDLLLSVRYKSTVFLYRPSEDKVIWLLTGPWLVQHAAKFVGDSTISVFGNDVFRNSDPPRGTVFINDHSNVYLYDLRTSKASTPYDRVLSQLGVRAASEGLSKILSNGDAFVEDSMSGRSFRISSQAVRWSFVNRQREGGPVGLLNWSRYLEADQVHELLPKLRCKR